MHMRHCTRFVLILSGLAALLASCQNGPVNLTPTATLLPILSRTPRVTATPEISRTPLPTFTHTPSITPTPLPPSETPTPSLTPTITGIIQSVQAVNVREGPGANFRALWALTPGTGVLVIGQDTTGQWINIRMEDGDEGWVSAALLFVPDTPTPFPSATPSPDLTALFIGTPLPTAIFGQGSPTATPPRAVQTATGAPRISPSPSPSPTPSPSPSGEGLPVVNVEAINQTATALIRRLTPATASPIAQATSTGQRPATIAAPTSAAATGIAVTPGPDAPREGIDVFAFCNNRAFAIPAPEDIAAGSIVELYWAWFARERSQVQNHIDRVAIDLRLNGETISILPAYRQPIRREGEKYAAYWYVPVGPLPAGEYLVTYRAEWDRAITDGDNWFGPGTNVPFEEESCTFTVR
jgi:hypothetical protein